MSKKALIEGPISPERIAKSIGNHSSKTGIGAHNIFLGQVRADKHEGKIVEEIEYSAYEDMAEKIFHEIRESIFEKYDISCMHIYHSVGKVKAGGISLFVFVSSKHRGVSYEASRDVVEQIKEKTPIWKKEIFEGEEYHWV
ncbi:MAG: molybdenum cofactor biosynthesis protein MoaE [Flavobacteriales bacterium]|jgi:molybdopterin synthase catalytic subunit|nr:molybdopterin converting factor [Parcubacteria group bacterium]MDP7430736.1 molybdenum cofactor biosynthesis protein MoaE [Flavobacteriales bacterium]HJN63140.1 molybdenum cofactor biosynthesis protein MoaE [Flavobacteriales bacterium]|tara:strand:- start:371 stop:793 length:423 start_codon:yes stop_codon:yes gene_type:complete